LLLISGCAETSPAGTDTTVPQTDTGQASSSPMDTAAAEQTTAPPATMPVGGKLTEDLIKTLFAARKPDAEFLGCGRTYYVDYIFYKVGEINGRPDIKIDCCNPFTGECLQEDALGGMVDDFRIYGYDCESISSDTLPVYMVSLLNLSEQEANLPIYPSCERLYWKNGQVELKSEPYCQFFLPLEMSGFYWGSDWAKTVLSGYRLGYQSVSFAFLAAPGSEVGEGNETIPLTHVDYDEGAHSLILMLQNTTLPSDFEKIGQSNDFLKSVQAVTKGDNVEVTITLNENVKSYSKDLGVYYSPDGTERTGILEISFEFDANPIISFS
jgi:hypothetical protein